MISASIVLYKNDINEITKTIGYSLRVDCIQRIYLIDNSPDDNLKSLFSLNEGKIKYYFQNKNLGFGSAHNIALEMSKGMGYKYHLILNPDIQFEPKVIDVLLEKLKKDNSIGLIMPKILNTDGSNQFLPKLLPYPMNLIVRVVKPLGVFFKRMNDDYLLKGFQDVEANVPVISGCFNIYSIEAYEEVGGYDDNFFMYYEDFDLSRRVHKKYKTLYYPKVSVVHGYERGATKSFKLFKIFVQSVIYYFNKYGWIFDAERKNINDIVLRELK